MSKDVLISIKPKWSDKIASGEKTIEVRKTRPKIETPFKCYIYCTKPSYPHEDFIFTDGGEGEIKGFYGGGKVIGEFVCDAIFPMSFYASDVSFFDTEPPLYVPGTCLTDKEIAEYFGNGKTGYAWHISDLKIYDEPKRLSDFKPWNRKLEEAPCSHIPLAYPKCEDCHECRVERPPQSWQFVEELK